VNRNVQIKAEQIARYIVGGAPLTRIAIEMGMSYDGLLRITKTDEYRQIEDEVRSRVLGQMDAKLSQRIDLRQQMADEMEDDAVPEAFKILLDNMRKKRDLKSALEVLDRDPRRQFAKGASNAQAQAQQQPSGVIRPPIDRSALTQAMADADITHALLNKQKDDSKPAQA
jgi:hypothetical protein